MQIVNFYYHCKKNDTIINHPTERVEVKGCFTLGMGNNVRYYVDEDTNKRVDRGYDYNPGEKYFCCVMEPIYKMDMPTLRLDMWLAEGERIFTDDLEELEGYISENYPGRLAEFRKRKKTLE